MPRHTLRSALLVLVLISGLSVGAASAAEVPLPSHLAYIRQYLEHHSPHSEGKVWWVSRGNDLGSLRPNWLLQTPNCWGSSVCGGVTGDFLNPASSRPNLSQLSQGGQQFIQVMTDMIGSAQKSVDISALLHVYFTPCPPFCVLPHVPAPILSGPDGQFLTAIVDGLKQAKGRGHEPMVRLLIGNYIPDIVIPHTGIHLPLAHFYNPKTFAEALRNRVGSWVKVQSGSMRTEFASFDHAKVVDVDGSAAIVGGENYWENDYLWTRSPVSDISMQVRGPAAAEVTRFQDKLWHYTCQHNRSAGLNVSVSVDLLHPPVGQQRAPLLSHCEQKIPTLEPVRTAPVTTKDPGGRNLYSFNPSNVLTDVPIMVVGKLGDGIPVPGSSSTSQPESRDFTRPPVQDNGACGSKVQSGAQVNVNNAHGRAYEYRNPGEDALRALILSARSSIFISQQDLFSCLPKRETLSTEVKLDDRLFAALASKIIDGVQVQIVLSAGKGGASDGYGNGWSLPDVARLLQDVVAKELLAKRLVQPGLVQTSKLEARQKICGKVGLAHIRSIPSARWPNGKEFANHAKLVAVDNQAFYIGSENLYPSRLQELGFIVEDNEAGGQLLRDYTSKLWNESRPDALIDPDAKAPNGTPQPKCPTAILRIR